jgi:hypothetical protein
LPKKVVPILASSSSVHYLWFVLSHIHTLQAKAAAALFVLVLLLSSCGKDALIEPAASGPVLTPKNTGGSVDPGTPDPSEGGTRDEDPTGDEPVTGSGDGISDDGDDLSDTERNRKKK